MHSIHLRHFITIKTLIIVGAVSLMITFLLLIFSDDLHNHRKASDRNKQMKPPGNLKSSEDDKKMFHWMQDNEADMKLNTNVSNKVLGDKSKGHLLFQKDTRPPLTVPRIAKYCNPPYNQDAGNEGLVAKDYKLLNVHVVIRHGDRSPISRLPNKAMGGPSCLVDTSQHLHLPKVANFVQVMAASSQKGSRFHRWPLYPTHPRCSDGQLTGLGALQHVLYGIHYNERYHQKHGLFDETNWHRKVVAHSTEVPRTFQSALAFLYGLLPNFDIEKINLKSSTNINFCEENIFGSACMCPGIEVFRNKASRDCRVDHNYIDVMKKYADVLDYVQKVLNVPQKELPYAAALMDGFSGIACHNVPPPCNSLGECITAKTIESIWEPVDFQSICLHKNENYRKYTRANMHGLLYRIALKMNSSMNNKAVPTFHLYSGHDTTVSPLITTLELQDAVWPGYASRITFELYKNVNTNDHVIRVLQNGRVVTSEVVFCRNKTVDDFCKFSDFYSHVTALDLKEYCKSLI